VTPDKPLVERIGSLLADLPADQLQAIEQLREAKDLLDDVLNEKMAQAALDGASLRQVALSAGLSPNAVPPRLARVESLKPYASGGRVTSPSLERARYDSELGRPPEDAVPATKPKLTFQKRRPTTT